MAALARDGDSRAVGITQVSEILYTAGVQLLGVLPQPYALATLYSGAVVLGAPRAEAARSLVSLLCAPPHAALRQHSGFAARAGA
jgi:molybdate transport system substrate-binding protein